MSCVTSPQANAAEREPLDKAASTRTEGTPLAHENASFVASPAGRNVRLLAELTEFPLRAEKFGVRGTFLFFGSARSLSPDDADKAPPTSRLQWTPKWYDETRRLAAMLTTWARAPAGVAMGQQCRSHFAGAGGEQPLVVCTGGGPGFMEAANRGAFEAGGLSMGVAITLPFEASLNPYITQGLNFRTEYFFTRKFWEMYSAKAVICAPGGVGTCDELFEAMTLKQTRHCPQMPIVLLGSSFWNRIIDWTAMAELGVVSDKDVADLHIVDTAEEAFEVVCRSLRAEAEGLKTPPAAD